MADLKGYRKIITNKMTGNKDFNHAKYKKTSQTATQGDGPGCDGFVCEGPDCEVQDLLIELKLCNIPYNDTLILGEILWRVSQPLIGYA